MENVDLIRAKKIASLSLFKSTAIYVVSAILMIFLMGKMISSFSNDFGVSFGKYTNSSYDKYSVSSAGTVEDTLNNALKSYFY